jgi:hypothetical protein
MGNITVIVPTSKIEDFNVGRVSEILKKEFPQFEYHIDDKYIQILYKDGVVTDLYFDEDSSYLIDFDRDIKQLIDDDRIELAEKLKDLDDMSPDLSKTLHTTYGRGVSHDYIEKNSIDQFLKDYFVAYIFDEGIHPEFIPPDYKSNKTLKYKEENPSGSDRIIKTFKKFFNK